MPDTIETGAAKAQMKRCSLCGGTYTGLGNNAQPFNGRCCDACNQRFVIPARIVRMNAGQDPRHFDEKGQDDATGKN